MLERNWVIHVTQIPKNQNCFFVCLFAWFFLITSQFTLSSLTRHLTDAAPFSSCTGEILIFVPAS